MTNILHRSANEPIREGLNWDERWMGSDGGLISCWERGRQLIIEKPELAAQAKNGELPIMGWRGGVEAKIKADKFGTLNYLAMLQGLRGEDLHIDLDGETTMVCARTGQLVSYKRDIPVSED